MKLFDRLTETDLNIFPIIGISNTADSLRAMLSQAVRYRIDNIGHYCHFSITFGVSRRYFVNRY